MGSNMAENHPVGFQWVMEAKARGATIIHVDPRYTRTSAMADLHLPIRAGTDIAFLGGLINYVLTNGRDFREYVLAYSNAATLISDQFVDTEELDGLFSGWDPDHHRYDPASWAYANAGNLPRHPGPQDPNLQDPNLQDPSLQDPRCVYQLLTAHFARYSPQMVAEVCGVRQELFERLAAAMCDNSGRDRTGAIAYSVAWTHHTVGVQNIRSAAILQTLLGNIGRPGGGILALRGHASIQGSTDIPTLFDLLPGYIAMPQRDTASSLAEYLATQAGGHDYRGRLEAYLVSLLCAWYGDHARARPDFGFDFLPRLTGDHSTYQTALGMLEGTVKGFFVLGENPAVGSANAGLHRKAMAKLDWLVVRDLQETETASFWYDAPEIDTGELRTADIGTEVFLLPAAAHTEKAGSFTQTQRLLQWRDQAIEPPGDCRSDLWFIWRLGAAVQRILADSPEERDHPIRYLTWDYPLIGVHGDPDAEAVLAEINGFDATGGHLSSYEQLRHDGSTSCGCWIYSGVFAEGVNQARRRKPGHEQTWVAPEWGWAWPANRRQLYNRASADPDGRPWSERKRYVWWDNAAARWEGPDEPDFPRTTHPDTTATGTEVGGADAFIMQADGKAWLYVPTGLVDGPLPTHYEPAESPVANRLYAQQDNPRLERINHPANPDNHSPGTNHSPPDHTVRYPFILSTYRLTEHHTTGAMSRTVSRLNALQPELFCEVSPELARLRGLDHGGWATIITSRAAIEARVMVTSRLAPIPTGTQGDGAVLHQVGLPWHWGWKGSSTGDVANDLLALDLDPNVHIQDTKSLTCDIHPGRRPTGPARAALVARHRGPDPAQEPPS